MGYEKMGISLYDLEKAIKNKSKLVAVKRTVQRKDGKSFQQTFYVSPEEAKQMYSKHTTVKEDTNKYTQNLISLGTGQPMSKEDAKKAIIDLRNKIGTQGLIDLAVQNGVTWTRNPNHIGNDYMQLAMKLTKHLMNGDKIGSKQTLKTEVKPSKPKEPKTEMQKLYESLSPKHKLIGLATGMLPEDDEALNFLSKKIKEGEIEIKSKNDFESQLKKKEASILSSLMYDLNRKSPDIVIKNLMGSNLVYALANEDISGYYTRKQLSELEKAFDMVGVKAEFQNLLANYKNLSSASINGADFKYKTGTVSEGLDPVVGMLKAMKYVKTTMGTNDFGKIKSDDLFDTLKEKFENTDPEELYDELKLGDISRSQGMFNSLLSMLQRDFGGSTSRVEDFYDTARKKDEFEDRFRIKIVRFLEEQPNWKTIPGHPFVRSNGAVLLASQRFDYMRDNPWFIDDIIEKGIISKEDVTLIVKDIMFSNNYYNDPIKRDNVENSLDSESKEMFKNLTIVELMSNRFKITNSDSEPGKAKIEKSTDSYGWSLKKSSSIMSDILEKVENRSLLKFNDFEPILEKFVENYEKIMFDKDTKYILYNLAIMHQQSKNVAPISKKGWLEKEPLNALIAESLIASRKNEKNIKSYFGKRESDSAKVDLTKDYYVSKLTGAQNDLDSVDIDRIIFPNSNDAEGKFINCTLQTLNGNELEKVTEKVEQDRDTINHRFPVRVQGAYKIKHFNDLEKDFQKVNHERNNTNFYFHGTSYNASQKILGETGRFKVSKTNVSTGRMLGDGVYLANKSSKAAQYSSNQFSRHGQGVLFICEASLGKVVHTDEKDTTISNRIWRQNEGNMDTLYIPKPYVDNDEWCVKDVEGVIPRILIDINKDRIV